MKTYPLARWRVYGLLLAAILSCGTTGFAQSSSAANNSPQDTMDQARDMFTKGNINAAETILFNDNDNKRNTGAWSLESGTKLMHLAASFVNRHDAANARAAAKEAIAYLNDAETRLAAEGKPATAARSQELAGTVYEFILRDDDAALGAYQKALKRNPNSDGAKNANARLNHQAKGNS
jgi:tetratricopeptide (TPR) repeat protein